MTPQQTLCDQPCRENSPIVDKLSPSPLKEKKGIMYSHLHRGCLNHHSCGHCHPVYRVDTEIREEYYSAYRRFSDTDQRHIPLYNCKFSDVLLESDITIRVKIHHWLKREEQGGRLKVR